MNILAPECVQKAISEASRNLGGEAVESSEYQFIAKDGSTRFGEVSGAPLIRDGNVAGVVVVARDITERGTTERARHETEKVYRLLADNMSDRVWMMDMNLAVTYVSPSVERLSGYTVEEVMTIPMEKQMAPQSLSLAMETFAQELERLEKAPKDAKMGTRPAA